MKTINSQVEPKDLVIAELHSHKRSIAREHGDDIATLLRDLMDRQAHDSRVVTSMKGEPGARPNAHSASAP
jgi:hypothetical protein